MRCKYCNVEIVGEAKVCPLCHQKLEHKEDEKLELVYPLRPPTTERKHKHFTFNTVYFVCSIIFCLTALTVNLCFDPSIKWFWFAIILCLYGFILVRNTIFSANSIAVKILVQMLSILFIMFVAQLIFSKYTPVASPEYWTDNYGFPVIIFLSLLTMFIFTCCLAKKKPALLLDCILFSFIGFLPMILFAFKLIVVLYPSLACAIISTISIASCLIFGHEELSNEWQKKFHV